MAETSRPRVTITLGRSGQVVKRAGPVVDSAFSNSQPAIGSKRSIRDRLGSNVDAKQLNNKRQRGESDRLRISATNGVDDMCLGKDDLRFKIMRKNVPKRTQSDGQQNGLDLREMLSRPSQSSTTSLGMQQCMPETRNVRHHMPEPRNVTHHMPEPKDVRHHRPEPKAVRQRMPEPTSASILGGISSVRTAHPQPQMDSLRNSYSPWTLDRLRRRSPDGVLSTSRGLSPSRNVEELQRRPLIRTYDDVRTVPYMSKDVLELSRSMGTASFATKSALSVGPAKPAAPLLPPLVPPSPVAHLLSPHVPQTSIVQKSSYTVDEQPTVEGLLHTLGLEKYVICFKHEEVDMTALRQMGDNDLKELGIPMGPRKKILLALLSRSKRQVR